MRIETTSRGIFKISGLLMAISLALSSCGASGKKKRAPTTDQPGENAGDGHENQNHNTMPEVLKGRWQISIGNDGHVDTVELADVSKGSASQPISGVVAPLVTFTVSNANFSTPPSPVGSASYGTLDVTGLNDNALRVCGTGTSRCTRGLIRIYTNGNGPGLWSDVEAAGLPISTGASTIGLSAANAVTVGSAVIGGQTKVLKLSNFTSSPALQIPIAVDFTDAAAGTYNSTLIVEYVLQ